MARYLLIVSTGNTTAIAVNAIEWDGVTPFSPPAGQIPVAVTNNEDMGWTRTTNSDGSFTWAAPQPAVVYGTTPQEETE